MTAIDRLKQIALFNVGRQTRTWPTALDINHDQRNLRHRRPAKGLHLQRYSRARTARNGQTAAVGEPNRHRHCCQLVFRLNEETAVLRQLSTQHFHDRRPRSDRIARSITNAASNQTKRDGRVPVHRNLRWTRIIRSMKRIVAVQNIIDREGKT